MNHYYKILELQPGATPDEVKAAYRDLAKVWHPDRFKTDSPRLKAKAAEKLAEINEAYEKIRTYQNRQKARKDAAANQASGQSRDFTGYRPFTPGSSPSSGQTYSGYSRPTSNGRAHGRTGSRSYRSASQSYQRHARSHSSSRAGASGQSPFRTPPSSDQETRSSSSSRTLARSGRSMQRRPYAYRYSYHRRRPKRSVSMMAVYLTIIAVLAITVAGTVYYVNKDAIDGPLPLSEWPAIIRPAPQPSTTVSEELPDETAAGAVGERETSYVTQPPDDVYNPPTSVDALKQAGGPVESGFFTLGSTKKEVLRLQGEPEQVRHGVFRYGFSSVFFEGDQVVGWHESPGAPLNVQLRPRRAYNLDYFTVGSTRDAVITVQGTPDHYGDGGRELRYGESRITFQRGRVISWHMNASSPLKARLVPKYPSDATVFTLGSSKDEVLSVQGTPDHFSENSFHYGHSIVHFANDRVSGWNEATNHPLEVELKPSNPTSSKYFTLGSTRDEVIAAQGTPNQYSERMLKYGYSTVSFENGKVVSWYQSAASPLKVRSGG